MRIVDSGRMDPIEVMAKDALLLENLSLDEDPLIHFYEWSVPCLTVGHFIDPAKYLDLQAVKDSGLQIAKRPTGGGIIFHLTDFAFSILIPAKHFLFSCNTLQNYAWINGKVAHAISDLISSIPTSLLQPTPKIQKSSTFCMAQPTPYDIIIEGKKAGGAAQRRTKRGLLHQATLSLGVPPVEILRKVLKDQNVGQAILDNTFCLMPHTPLEIARAKIKELLCRHLFLGA